MAELGVSEQHTKLKSAAATASLESLSKVLVEVLDPFLLSSELCAKGVLESEVLDRIITNSEKTKKEKAVATIAVVTDKVTSEPGVLGRLCEVLCGDPATKDIGTSLKRCYGDTLVEKLRLKYSPEDLIKICHKEGLIESCARIVVKSKDFDLSSAALQSSQTASNRLLLDQIVHTTVLEEEDPEAVSQLIKSFMMADLPNELIILLETVLFNEKSSFKDNRNLQNLLILTGVKADSARVSGYISRLNNFDGPDLAMICLSSGLNEEAFAIYKKCNKMVDAIKVLVEHVKDLERARGFAEECDQPDVWEVLNKL